MSVDFIDPDVLVRLVRLYGCLDFSQIARFSRPPGCESKGARRARLKFTAAALHRAVVSEHLFPLRVTAWQPRRHWSVLWDSSVDGNTLGAPTDERFDEVLAFKVRCNWLEAATLPTIEVFFARNFNFKLLVGKPVLLSAQLMVSEFYWSLVDAGANVTWLSRHDPQLIAASASCFDADEFPYIQYREHGLTSVAVAPVLKDDDNERFHIDLKRFRQACLDLGYRCLVLSAKPLENQSLSF